jgi:hypothetical protein
MEHSARSSEERPGATLGQMLDGYRMFLENVYALLRFLETEVTRQGWELVKNGGYAVTRNGLGRGLSSFTSADWVTNEAGIAFVGTGKASMVKGATNTPVPATGLEVLVFQVRWLEKSPAEPVVWYARLHVEPEEALSKKWEDYQSQVFARLDPAAADDDTHAGAVQPGRVSLSGEAIVYSGRYVAVPVAGLQTQEDIVVRLLQPALSGDRKSVV